MRRSHATKKKHAFLDVFFTCSQNSSLRNKRPDLSGRPPCKGVAIGVARRGGRLGGERTLRVPPCCSFPVSHSGGPHVVSFVAGRRPYRPCARGARVRAGVARRAAESAWRIEYKSSISETRKVQSCYVARRKKSKVLTFFFNRSPFHFNRTATPFKRSADIR